MNRSDKQLLDGLQALCSRGVECRWSVCGRGWRLHESAKSDAKVSVREAIDAFLDAHLKQDSKAGGGEGEG